MFRHLRFWGAIGTCWGAALAALYVHPAFWVVFGFVLVFFIARELKNWKSGA